MRLTFALLFSLCASVASAQITMTVDSALGEVPANVFPLTDDGDFKSRETSVAYNAAGMDLVWNFVGIDGSFTQTAVTPSDPSANGNYEWEHQGDGFYTVKVPASGGASINNDAEGYGWFSGVATGVLPWRGPVIQFVPANVSNSLVAGTDKLETDTTLIEGGDATNALGTAATASLNSYDPPTHTELTTLIGTPTGASVSADLASILDDTGTSGVVVAAGSKTGYSLTQSFPSNFASLGINASGHISRVTLADTVTTLTGHTAQTGDAYARLGAPVGASISADLQTVDANVDSILADTNEMQTDLANGGRLDLLFDATLKADVPYDVTTTNGTLETTFESQ